MASAREFAGAVEANLPSEVQSLTSGNDVSWIRQKAELKAVREEEGLTNLHGGAALHQGHDAYVDFVEEGTQRVCSYGSQSVRISLGVLCCEE